ncbi:MAG: hypothetical protein PF487_08980 [Bacteroidales bacterium]|jgi:hypothetical protein|nr:hypothetical protein [Bacteroidales bacterium]
MTNEHFLLGTLKCIQQGLFDDVQDMRVNASQVINKVNKPPVKNKFYGVYMFLHSLSNGYYHKYNHIKSLSHRTLNDFYRYKYSKN